MSRTMDAAERLHLESTSEWRAWLRAHHGQAGGVWLVSWRRATGKPSIPYDEAVEEALCYGWIDSTAKRLDDERGMLWFSPRRKGSPWSRSNKERVARLEADGRVAAAGRAAIERAKTDGSWTILDPVEALEVPDDLAAALKDRTGAMAAWAALPATARRAYLFWIATAKRADTRARRVAESASLVAAGKRLEERQPLR